MPHNRCEEQKIALFAFLGVWNFLRSQFSHKIRDVVQKNYIASEKVGHFYFYDNFDKSGPNFIIFNVKFRKDMREKSELKLPPPLKSDAALPCEKQVVNYVASCICTNCDNDMTD